jgi:hypothetical protein
MFLSSLPARIDPSDWLDEELPILGGGELGGVPGGLDPDGLAVSYSPVAELDVIDVAERASAMAPLAVGDEYGVELSVNRENLVQFRICQNKLNR